MALPAAPLTPVGSHHEDDRACYGEDDLPGINPKERRTAGAHGEGRGDDETGERPLHRAPAYLALDVTGKPLHSRLRGDCRFPWYGVVQS